ncbi:MAG: CopG family ribbon-helix-helix protein [Chloroflexota bacterium]
MVRATVTIPDTLLADVDLLAGKGGRSAFVADALEAKVKRERLRRVLDDTRGVLKDSAWWKTPDETYRWVREQRVDRDAEP